MVEIKRASLNDFSIVFLLLEELYSNEKLMKDKTFGIYRKLLKNKEVI